MVHGLAGDATALRQACRNADVNPQPNRQHPPTGTLRRSLQDKLVTLLTHCRLYRSEICWMHTCRQIHIQTWQSMVLLPSLLRRLRRSRIFWSKAP
jgi:hypothetical protein